MKKLFSLKRILLALLIVFGVIQFFRIDKTNPPVVPGNDIIAIEKPPAEIEKLLRGACFDCHSNETRYPWYSNIAPVSWWLKNHIQEGREEMNFSEWATFSARKRDKKLEESNEMIKENEMPLKSFTWVHKEAQLNAGDKLKLAQWFQSRRTGSSGEHEED